MIHSIPAAKQFSRIYFHFVLFSSFFDNLGRNLSLSTSKLIPVLYYALLQGKTKKSKV